MDITAPVGLGGSELHQAVRAEADRIVRETKGDVAAQTAVLYGMLRRRGLLQDDEVETLSALARLGAGTADGDGDARTAFFRARDVHSALLASGTASPVALALASSAVGSYSVEPAPGGSGVTVYAKNQGEWEKRGAALGALIGADWGAGGAAIGGLIGGAVGAAVDKCVS
ncbi:hypothetical protein [Nakamurella endophytica]|uniref:Uncharacterized protein n=1 Tax=Nakamurella endophytica TaxID=1748367 RepID=A0A917T8D6_9ACTN|nr:hypothetical protein [Nakamurella endophytica]GGM13754.1 hypothetical protein GCM10011594_37040 [Nakamurella endophytica]